MTMKAENGTMELEHLHIRRKASYETENANRFVAEVKYKGKSGCVELLLDPEIAEALLGFIGPALSKAAGKAALEIERNIQIAVAEVKQPQIELGSEPQCTESHSGSKHLTKVSDAWFECDGCRKLYAYTTATAPTPHGGGWRLPPFVSSGP